MLGDMISEERGQMTGIRVLPSTDGDAVSWRGQGIGRFTGRGGATSWRGVIFYETASQTLARLNGIAGVFEFEVDEGDKVEAKDWQWK